MVQGELFREEPVIHSALKSSPSFLAQYQLTLSLDKLVLVFIGIMIVFVLTYSFGVEQGKRQSEKRFETLVPTHEEVFRLANQTVLKADPQEEVVLDVSQKASAGARTNQAAQTDSSIASPDASVQAQSSLPVALPEKGKYTIQLVTYLSERQAIEEINRLKTKGYEGFVIPSGRHYQVCVDYFQSQSEARKILTHLKLTGRYNDAFVRPVVR